MLDLDCFRSLKFKLLHRAVFFYYYYYHQKVFYIWFMLFVCYINLLCFWYKEFDSLSVLFQYHNFSRIKPCETFMLLKFASQSQCKLTIIACIDSLLIRQFFLVHFLLFTSNRYCILSITQVANRSIRNLDFDSHPYI